MAKAALLFTKQRSPCSNAINQTPFNKSLFSSYPVPILISIIPFHSSNKRAKREVIPYFFQSQPRSSCESSATIPSFRFPFVLFLRVFIDKYHIIWSQHFEQILFWKELIFWEVSTFSCKKILGTEQKPSLKSQCTVAQTMLHNDYFFI